MQQSILTLIQDAVAIGGGIIVAHGWLTSSTETAIAGGILSVATVIVGQFLAPKTTTTTTTVTPVSTGATTTVATTVSK